MQRYRSGLLGLAVGDALGTTLEFKPPGTFLPLMDKVGGGPFHLQRGEWTDDTSMALCLAKSFIERQGFDPVDQLERYCRWYRNGHLSSNGRCFDIGTMVLAALRRFEQTHEPYCGSSDPMSAGNGSLMRLAPVPLAYACRPADVIEHAGESSRTTHGAATAVDVCRYLGELILGALRGVSKDRLLAGPFSPIPRYWEEHPLAPEIAAVAAGSFKHKHPPGICGTRYAVDCLEAALWAFHRSMSFREERLLAVDLGDGADTTGAFYGARGIPEPGRATLAHRTLIELLADHLCQLVHTR
jgi:ADP-ribosyl-[dinitrogen reductase] hydrolase